MDANIASLIIFIGMAVLSWVPYLQWAVWAVPLVFFFIEKESKFVKFQAVMALIVGIISAGISLILQIIIWILMPRTLSSAFSFFVGGGWNVWAVLSTISLIIGLAILALYIFLIVMAVTYKQVELPLIGPIATKASEKLESVGK